MTRSRVDGTIAAASTRSRMASVWFPFMVLAGLGAADALSPESRGALGDLEPLFSVFQISRGRAGGIAYVPVQVWKFLKGKDPSALAALFLGKGHSFKGNQKINICKRKLPPIFW